jgi:hypothetical protein
MPFMLLLHQKGEENCKGLKACQKPKPNRKKDAKIIAESLEQPMNVLSRAQHVIQISFSNKMHALPQPAGNRAYSRRYLPGLWPSKAALRISQRSHRCSLVRPSSQGPLPPSRPPPPAASPAQLGQDRAHVPLLLRAARAGAARAPAATLPAVVHAAHPALVQVCAPDAEAPAPGVGARAVAGGVLGGEVEGLPRIAVLHAEDCLVGRDYVIGVTLAPEKAGLVDEPIGGEGVRACVLVC